MSDSSHESGYSERCDVTWSIRAPYHVACAALKGPTPYDWTETWDVRLSRRGVSHRNAFGGDVLAACTSREAAYAAVRLLLIDGAK